MKGLVLNSINRLSENDVSENASTDGCLRKRKKKNINNQHLDVHKCFEATRPEGGETDMDAILGP